MSFHAPMKLRRALDAIDLELAAAGPDLASADLIARARMIHQEASAVGLEVFAAMATLREGEIHLASGAIDQACATLKRAATALGATTATDLHTVALARWSEALLASGDFASVLRVCANGIDLIERDRYKTSAPYLQASYLRPTITLYSNGVRAACELGDERALVWVELSKSRHLPGRRGLPVPANAGATAQERFKLQDELTDLSDRIDQRAARGRDTTGLRQKRRVHYDRLVTLDRRHAGPVTPEPHRIPEQLAADQAVVSYYWLDPTRLMITTVTAADVHSRVAPVPAEALAALRQFAETVIGAPGALTSKVSSGDINATVAHLSPILLPPAVLKDIDGAERLLVSPHRLLHAVPFGALPVDGAPLIRHASVTVIPNLTCLQLAAPPRRSTRVLGVGAVDCHVQLAREDGALTTPKPLRLAEREAADVTEIYRAEGVPADTLLGDRIDEDELRRRCSDLKTSPTVLHLVLHGANVESDTPLESWLLLPHSRLDGIDLVRWRLDGCTVVLSACSAGQRAVGGRRMQELPGDDVFGLQAALFDAGAHQIVAALWPVDGNAAGALLRRFHQHLRDGAPADIALQRAVVTFLDEANRFLNRPQYWAPFYLTCLGIPTTLGGAP